MVWHVLQKKCALRMVLQGSEENGVTTLSVDRPRGLQEVSTAQHLDCGWNATGGAAM